MAVACSASNEEADGQAAAASDDPIVGGVKAADGAWPGAVAIFEDGDQVCDGTLVAPTWVLTAGHCIDDIHAANGGLQKVMLGRNKLSGTGGEEIAITRAIRHPDYYGPKHQADVALLELATPSKQPVVKLLPATKARSIYRSTTKLTVIGWGVTSKDSQDSSDDLLEAQVPFISQATCKTFTSYKFLLDSQFCAGLIKGGKDACQGDSGGPIFTRVGSDWVQAGIVSWGIGCADAKAPGVYTRVTEYLDWISSTQAAPPADADAGTADASTN